MSELVKILGNEGNIEYLTEAAERGKLSHAYIIEGAKGSGKRTLSEYFAMRLLCTGEGSRPCGKCPACIKAMSGNHPDLIRVVHEKKTVLSIGELRRQVIDTIHIPPYYGPYKIYIIADSELMNAHGQNALLKTIEEPPAYALIFLLTSNADTFLDTILSRCVKLTMEALPAETVKAQLIRRGIESSKALEIASLAKGNLGNALLFAQDENAAALKDRVTSRLKDIERADASQLAKDAASVDADERLLFLNLFRMWFRDVLFLKSGLPSGGLYFEKEKDVLSLQADGLSYEDINEIINEITVAEDRLRAQVKADQVIELLLLNVRRVFKGGRLPENGI